mmetsp:Transcript_86925/g.246129  ORF Transcript_86925/g.246129 Transcript_86925/m.246129 type:complete len:119 (-) Transcript_86925:1015-1371(-)
MSCPVMSSSGRVSIDLQTSMVSELVGGWRMKKVMLVKKSQHIGALACPTRQRHPSALNAAHGMYKSIIREKLKDRLMQVFFLSGLAGPYVSVWGMLQYPPGGSGQLQPHRASGTSMIS